MGGSQRPLNPDILGSQGPLPPRGRGELKDAYTPGQSYAEPWRSLRLRTKREASGAPVQAGELGQDKTVSWLLILQFPHENG